MTVPSDHLANVGTAHFYFKDQFFPLLLLCHQHFVGRIHQVLDHELEEIFHGDLLCGWRRNYGSLAGLFDDARHRLARLSAVLNPVFRAIEVNLVVLATLPRIVVTNHFNEFTVTRTSFVRHYYAIKRAILRAFSP
jgi:hypothetical protein